MINIVVYFTKTLYNTLEQRTILSSQSFQVETWAANSGIWVAGASIIIRPNLDHDRRFISLLPNYVACKT